MTFEPVKVLHSVLEFFYSSGMINIAEKPVQILTARFSLVHGQKQKYEQLLFFVLGHLLPEFTPLKLELSIIERIEPSKNAFLCTTFKLPSASNATLSQLQEAIQNDERLKKLLMLAQAACNDSPSRDPDCSRVIVLEYPINSVVESSSQPAIDIKELQERFEGTDMAFSLLEGFVMNARRHLSMLTNAVEKLDWIEAHRHAHALKGGALNVCAVPFADRAKIVELSIKDGRLDEVLPGISQLDLACTELETAWAAYREELHG